MGRYHYSDHLDLPELIALCVYCTKEDCSGLCSEYKARFQALMDGRTPEKDEIVAPIGEIQAASRQ